MDTPASQAGLIVCTGNELVTVYAKACQAAELTSQRLIVMMSTSNIIMFVTILGILVPWTLFPRIFSPHGQIFPDEGCIQSVDWTGGLDYWTGLLDSNFTTL